NNPVADDASHQQISGRAVHFYNVRLSAREAWFGATIAALFNALGMLLEIEVVRKFPGVSVTPAAISALIALLLLIVLFIRRKTPLVKLASFFYLINATSVITVLVLTNLPFAVATKNWEPFQATKLGCLVAAMLAPGFWVGLSAVLAHSLSAVFQFEF